MMGRREGRGEDGGEGRGGEGRGGERRGREGGREGGRRGGRGKRCIMSLLAFAHMLLAVSTHAIVATKSGPNMPF